MNNKIALAVVSTLIMAAPLFASAETLNRQLEVGMSGADVSALQSFLAQDATLYPQGLVTGYFGLLTKAAVANFQARNGLPAVGRVGPMTLPVLNAQMAGGTGGDDIVANISNVNASAGSTGATVSWNTSESAKGVVYYSSSPLVQHEGWNFVGVSGGAAMTDTSLRTSQSVSISNLQANTTYHYLVYATDQAGNVSVTVPATFRTSN
ncbi:MAG: peptidoglycan-binding protein [Patescibacteria group bacterium]